MGEDAYIEFCEITKYFGDFCALDKVSLRIPQNTFVTLLGPSGCGKTTLMRLLAGFSEPESGDILINGKRVNGLPPYRRDTPLVFQDYALFPHMTIFENISYGLRLQKIPKKERKVKVTEMLKMLNLEGLENRFPKQLSGGQQQRTAIARALVMGKDILLLDEPLSNLDAKLRVEVRVELRQIQKKLKNTIIYVTHDQDEALSMSDTIAVMRQGRIEQVGTPKEIYFQPANRFVAEFVGTVNLVDACVVNKGFSNVTVSFFGKHIGLRSERNWKPGDHVTLAVRPENIRLAESGSTPDDCLYGKIVDSSFLGRMTRYWVQTEAQTLIVDDLKPAQFNGNASDAALILDTSNIHILTDNG